MFFSRKKNKAESSKISWNSIEKPLDIETIKEVSAEKPVIIFKHSTTCPISSTALDRFERKWNMETNASIYLLNLLQYRDLSQLISVEFNVEHQSPQVLVIKNGKSIYDESHFGISAEKIEELL